MEENIYHLQYALDTFYFLMCGALVMWMAAGFAMLESGLVRAKNTAEILTKNIVLYATASVMYLVCGFAIMYGDKFFVAGIGAVDVNQTLKSFSEREGGFGGGAIFSPAANFFFQVVFAATCMSIVSGAVAERMKLWAFLLFSLIMVGCIYPVEGSWVWGSAGVFGLNLDDQFGFKDFAGSGVVHLTGAAAALSGVLLLGARKGKYGSSGEVHAIPGANLPIATLGAIILWFGWFGFNGGSVLKLGDITSANTIAVVFVNTNASAAGGLIGALLVARVLFGKADLTMILNGALAGLVAITASPDTPGAIGSVFIGLIAGAIVVFSILGLDKLRIDDPVGAISVHGAAGLYGLLVVPFTATGTSFAGQLIGALAIFGWVFATSFVAWFAIKRVMGIRVSEEEEFEGVDLAECGMEAYPEFTNK
ncbi:MAG: ammonium transporter [Cellvibrio sp. 79]|nr:MAG: ammonium transporter [Cellvibrio sp. 79]